MYIWKHHGNVVVGGGVAGPIVAVAVVMMNVC